MTTPNPMEQIAVSMDWTETEDYVRPPAKRIPRASYGGWAVRVVGQGVDKSEYYIVRVNEPVGYTGLTLTHFKGGRAFQRGETVVHATRAGARAEKKRRTVGKSNCNSWDDNGDY